MREMDSHFGDLYGMIFEREIDISHELAQHILEYEEVITRASDIFGELDRYVMTTKAVPHLLKIVAIQTTLTITVFSL